MMSDVRLGQYSSSDGGCVVDCESWSRSPRAETRIVDGLLCVNVHVHVHVHVHVGD